MFTISRRTVVRLARQYGLNPNGRAVLENVKQAQSIHGQQARNFDGDLSRFWGCDRTGRYDAVRLLDGYLSQIAFESDCDGRAHADFCRNAYGD